MKDAMKRVLSFVLAAVMVFGMVPGFALVANAAGDAGSATLLDGALVATWTGPSNSTGTATWTAADEGITCTTLGDSNNKAITTTLTLTNNTETDATLAFSYVLLASNNRFCGNMVIGSGDAIVATASPGTSGNYSATIKAGESLEIVVTSAANKATARATNTLTITNLSLSGAQTVETTFQPAANGSYTVDGTAITAAQSMEKEDTQTYAMEAAANSGYVFFGWYSNTTESYVSFENPVDMKVANVAAQEVTAIFVADTCALFGVGSAKFTDLAEACDYAVSSGEATIVLLNNGTIDGDYTIPAGKTFLIPYNEAHTVLTTASCTGLIGNPGADGTVPVPYETPYAFRTLTLTAGSTLTVKGAVCVAGQHSSGNGSGQETAGSPSGPVGFVQMGADSQIIVANGGNLYCWGYIVGGGKVTAESGATVHENFQFTDFRGGSVTSVMATEFTVFPLTQYYVQNIEVPLTLEYGAQEAVSTSIFMSKRVFSASVNFIGQGGMFVPGAGAKLTKTYVGSTDRLLLEVDGNAEINAMALELGGTAINSSAFALPLNSNIDIQIHSGKTVLNQSMSLLPGVTLTIDEDAELNVAKGGPTNAEYPDSYMVNIDGEPLYETGHNLIAYDAADWGNYVHNNVTTRPLSYAYSMDCNRAAGELTSAVITVNGVLSADGYLYTTLNNGDGAPIVSDGGGVVKFNNGVGEDYTTWQVTQKVTAYEYVDIYMSSALLFNADGSYVDTYDAYYGAYEDLGEAHYYQYVNGEWKLNYVAPTTATVTFETGDYAEAIAPITKDVGENITLPTAERTGEDADGYSFAGWDADNDGIVDYVAEAEITLTSDLTLYPVWEKASFTVTYLYNGSQLRQDTIVFGDAIPAYTPDMTVEGHTFKGWDSVAPETMPAENLVFNAVYEASVYNVSFYLTNLSYDGAATAVYGEKYTATLTPDRCYVLNEVAVQMDGDDYSGYILENGELTIEWVTGNIEITATAVEQHTEADAVEVNRTEATCKQDGGYSSVVSCSVCGTELSNVYVTIPATGNHVYKNLDFSQDATCIDQGKKIWMCDCGEMKTEEIEPDPNNHTAIVEKEEVEATCTTDGSRGGTWCTDCGKVIEEPEVIEALGHGHTNGYRYEREDIKYHSVVCGDCGLAVESVEHKYATLGYYNEATCVEQGSYEYVCVCGEYPGLPEILPIEPDNHINIEDMEESDATCTTAGSHGGTKCTDCGKVIEEPEVIEALGHSHTNGVRYDSVNYEYHIVSCGDCGQNAKTEAHEFGDDNTCVCGLASYKLTIWADTESGMLPIFEGQVATGTKLSNLEAVKKMEKEPIYVNNNAVVGKYELLCWATSEYEGLNIENATMPASDYEFIAITYIVGWVSDDGGTTWSYTADGINFYVGWHEINEADYTENGTGTAKYYFVGDEAGFIQAYRATDITEIDGVLYAFDHETGKFLSDYTGLYTANNGTVYHVVEGIATQSHTVEPVITDNKDGSTHDSYYSCCDVTETSDHVYDEDTDKCVCGAEKPIEMYTLTIKLESVVIGYPIFECQVAPGTSLSELDAVRNVAQTVYYSDEFFVGRFVFGYWMDSDMNWLDMENATMPAADCEIGAFYNSIGWYTYGDGTWSYFNFNEFYEGWHDIAEIEYLENGSDQAWRYYFAEDESGWYVRVTDITEIDGVLYAFDHETGKFLSDYTGLYTANNGDIYYVENGVAVENKGLVRTVTDAGIVEYYYFGCSETDKDSHEDNSCDAYKAQKGCVHWVENNNGYLVQWDYTFDENGVIVHHADTSRNGVYADEGGVDCYYIDGVKVHKGLFDGTGVIGVEDGYYYYARSSGALVKDRDYWVSDTNGLLEEGSYTFNEKGQIVFEEEVLKNGICEEDDSLYLYVDGKRTYKGLFIGDGIVGEEGKYYYANTKGEVINGRRYYVTKHNDLLDDGWYDFNEEGQIVFPEVKNGFVDENGATYYYVDGVKTYAGLIEVDGELYYVNSSCKVIKDRTYWVTKHNGLLEDEGWQTFDADGKMVVSEPEPLKNGFVDEDGVTYYYVDGVKTYAGLIEVDGELYYVNSSCKVIKARTYWVTKHNGLLESEGWQVFDENGKMVTE